MLTVSTLGLYMLPLPTVDTPEDLLRKWECHRSAMLLKKALKRSRLARFCADLAHNCFAQSVLVGAIPFGSPRRITRSSQLESDSARHDSFSFCQKREYSDSPWKRKVVHLRCDLHCIFCLKKGRHSSFHNGNATDQLYYEKIWKTHPSTVGSG